MDTAKLERVYQDVEVYGCQNNSKDFRRDSPRVEPTSPGNRAGLNGSGRVLVVDIDTKNGGSLELLRECFPAIPDTPTVTIQTASGTGRHLVYRLPVATKIRRNHYLCRGVEIPNFYMLPKSKVWSIEYQELGDNSLSDCPPDLLAEVSNDLVERDTQLSPLRVSSEHVDALLQEWANCSPGERNSMFQRVALPVLRAYGEYQGSTLLKDYYPGEDSDELEWMIVSAAKKLGEGHYSDTTEAKRISETREQAILQLLNRARFGEWKGKTAANDRLVYLALANQALAINELSVRIPPESLSTAIALRPDTTRDALRRLRSTGKVALPYPGEPIYRLVCSETGGYLSKGNNLYLSKGAISPLDLVWRCDGLRGRHSHVFDLVQVGVQSQTDIARLSGSSKTNVSEVVTALQEHGLIHVNGRVITSVSNAPEVAYQLAQDLGGFYRQKVVSDGIGRDHQRLEDHNNRRRYGEIEALRDQGV